MVLGGLLTVSRAIMTDEQRDRVSDTLLGMILGVLIALVIILCKMAHLF